MATTEASCPLSFHVGATAVLRISAPIKNSSPRDNEWPSLVLLSVISPKTDLDSRACRRYIQTACNAPMMMSAATPSPKYAVYRAIDLAISCIGHLPLLTSNLQSGPLLKLLGYHRFRSYLKEP